MPFVKYSDEDKLYYLDKDNQELITNDNQFYKSYLVNIINKSTINEQDYITNFDGASIEIYTRKNLEQDFQKITNSYLDVNQTEKEIANSFLINSFQKANIQLKLKLINFTDNTKIYLMLDAN